MDARTLAIFFLVLAPIIIEAWQTLDRRSARESRRDIHYHSKRHMLPRDSERKRRTTTPRPKEIRKKPSGHLRPLQEDDMENDEVVSVAIGPPAIRPKYDKIYKHPPKPVNRTIANDSSVTNLIKDVLVQLGKDFLTHQVNEDFVFGQYIGNCMKNLTNELRLKMQHEILDLIVKYQRLSRGEVQKPVPTSSLPEEKSTLSILKEIKSERKANETDEGWPDFTNLANIVG